MAFHPTYKEWKRFLEKQLEWYKPGNTLGVEDCITGETDEQSLTERERLIHIMVCTRYEIDHNWLSKEMKDELYLYYEQLVKNELDKELGEEKEVIAKELTKMFFEVYPDGLED